jgi:hypothetical protein
MLDRAAPDSNVGVAEAPSRGSGAAARLPALARLLLFEVLLTVVALALSLPMSGCIIPVAPDFQDPISSPNYPPYLVSETPVPFGQLVTIQATDQVSFSAVVTDQNPQDSIWYQWVYDDASPNTSTATHALGAFELKPTLDGSAWTIPPVEVSCGVGLAVSPNSLHQLELIVSDRQPNFHPNGPFDDIPLPGFHVYGNWPFLALCGGTSMVSTP